MTLIPAYKKDDALVAEMDALASEPQGYRLWWLGQSGYLLQWKGMRVLIDPYLSDSLTNKYAATDKPHVRMSERVLSPGALRNIRVVTSSHNHTDHLDAETLMPVLANNPGSTLIIPEANRDFVSQRLNCGREFPTGMNDGTSVTIAEFSFYGIPAKHDEIERDEAGHCRYMGYVISFGPYKIYHSGDTLWFDELPILLRPFEVDVALLPINGHDPARRVAGNLNAREAVALGKQIGARCVIPCHYDMFSFNTAKVEDFVLEAEKTRQPYVVLRGGESFAGK